MAFVRFRTGGLGSRWGGASVGQDVGGHGGCGEGGGVLRFEVFWRY